jgi:hypothetical protein
MIGLLYASSPDAFCTSSQTTRADPIARYDDCGEEAYVVAKPHPRTQKTQMKYPTPRRRRIFLAIWNGQKRIITRQQSRDAAIAFLEACK